VNVVSLLLAVLLAAPQAPYQEMVEVRLHNIDVVVTDAKGAPVHDLRQDDFVLREDGKAQAISNFSEYRVDAGSAPPAPVAVSETPGPPETAPVSATVSVPPPRTFIIFIDEMGLNPGTVKSLNASLQKLIGDMREGDLAAVVRPTDSLNVSLQLTSDREAVSKQIAEAMDDSLITKGRKGLAADLYYLQREKKTLVLGAERQMGLRYANRIRERCIQRLGTLRAIITALAPSEGRKVLVAVTQSLSARPGLEFMGAVRQQAVRDAENRASEVALPGMVVDDQPLAITNDADARRSRDLYDLRPQIASLARVASSNGVTLYVLRPATDVTFRDSTPEFTSIQWEDEAGTDLDQSGLEIMGALSANTTEAVTPLVDITGGRHFLPGDDFDGVVRQIETDVSSYYSLAYHASGGIDKAHKVDVRVRNHPEYRVHARSEVERKSPRRELTDRVVASLLQKDPENDLGIRVATVPGKFGAVEVDIMIPLGALAFEHVGKVYRAQYDAHYAITGKMTGFVSGSDQSRLIEIPERDWPAARSKHWTHVVNFHAGADDYRVAVGVMDVNNQRSGIVTTAVVHASR
jgi:VWFA-related protein